MRLTTAMGAFALAVLPGFALAAGLTKTPASMVSGLADGATTQQNSNGTVSVIPGGLTGLSASGITTGTLPAAQLPTPTSSSIGGVQSAAAPANQFQTGINSSGIPQFAQPSFGNLAGTLTTGQVPAVSTQYFSGDGSTTAFTLSAAPYASTKLSVYVGGIKQQMTQSWSVSGTTLTFTAAPPSGTNMIEVDVGP